MLRFRTHQLSQFYFGFQRYATQAQKPLFDKILIANRGEIACRVIKTARKLGIRTVSVYSDADKNSMHVQLADEAYYIGKPPAKESYLLGEKILDIAKRVNANAIHPGYGFLSENAEFAEACHKNGVVFIGPPASAIRAMGSKSASKYIMENAKVPVVPGYHGADQSDSTLANAASQIGYPVLIKAWMGGGGKGMRIVFDPKDFQSSLESARRESMSSFGDDRVLVEKYLVRPRHIELQVFADTHGNCVYVFERDCSIQRRHQKVIEEAPAPGMSEEKRREMGTAAVNAAKAVGYVGAGTVEFIVDEDESFYFMEMNTRLQVEHPVSEMISKQDLVEWQIQAASGNPLPLTQDQLQIHGHALEARIYAENPDNNFLPGTGKLSFLRTPSESENVRVDTGVRMGDEVSVYYDPMIAKLIIWANDRETAIKKMFNALDEYQIVGLTTNIPFLKRVITHNAFREGKLDTKFIEQYKKDLLTTENTTIPPVVLALGSFYSLLTDTSKSKDRLSAISSPWASLSSRRFNHGFDKEVEFIVNEKKHAIRVASTGNSENYQFVIDSTEKFEIEGKLLNEFDIVARVNDQTLSATVVPYDQSLFIFFNSELFEISIPVPSYTSSKVDSGALISPMPGRVIKINVTEGQTVKEGDSLMIMEAMKMEHQIKANCDGVVSGIFFNVGDIVEAKTVLISVKPKEEK